VTSEQESRLRWLSDETVYRMAEQFVARNGNFIGDENGRKQVNGLLKYVRVGIDALDRFAQKQADRNWTGSKLHYGTIYTALHAELEKLRTLASKEGFAAEELPDRLACEYVQHLVAEMLYCQKGS